MFCILTGLNVPEQQLLSHLLSANWLLVTEGKREEVGPTCRSRQSAQKKTGRWQRTAPCKHGDATEASLTGGTLSAQPGGQKTCRSQRKPRTPLWDKHRSNCCSDDSDGGESAQSSSYLEGINRLWTCGRNRTFTGFTWQMWQTFWKQLFSPFLLII